MKNLQTITFIVGLPASGKSVLLSKLCKENNFTLGFDDPQEDSLELAIEMLKNNLNIVFADCSLCIEENRTTAIKIITDVCPSIEIKWIFFENSPEKCYKNLKTRVNSGDTRDVETDIRVLSESYTFIKDSEIREIYQSDNQV